MRTQIDSQFLEALRDLFQLFLDRFGVWGTIAIMALVPIGLFLWRLHNDRRAERGWKAALAEKENTIQRLASQERAWRFLFVIDKGLTKEEAERIILRNEFRDPLEAREVLERPKEETGGGPQG